ncbi:hypothetical protein ATCC90586_009452 [Pythium insidiosum]|nr:hypothetical protein ATCC90586_009452 [Pythium insidiosum]
MGRGSEAGGGKAVAVDNNSSSRASSVSLDDEPSRALFQGLFKDLGKQAMAMESIMRLVCGKVDKLETWVTEMSYGMTELDLKLRNIAHNIEGTAANVDEAASVNRWAVPPDDDVAAMKKAATTVVKKVGPNNKQMRMSGMVAGILDRLTDAPATSESESKPHKKRSKRPTAGAVAVAVATPAEKSRGDGDEHSGDESGSVVAAAQKPHKTKKKKKASKSETETEKDVLEVWPGVVREVEETKTAEDKTPPAPVEREVAAHVDAPLVEEDTSRTTEKAVEVDQDVAGRSDSVGQESSAIDTIDEEEVEPIDEPREGPAREAEPNGEAVGDPLESPSTTPRAGSARSDPTDRIEAQETLALGIEDQAKEHDEETEKEELSNTNLVVEDGGVAADPNVASIASSRDEETADAVIEKTPRHEKLERDENDDDAVALAASPVQEADPHNKEDTPLETATPSVTAPTETNAETTEVRQHTDAVAKPPAVASQVIADAPELDDDANDQEPSTPRERSDEKELENEEKEEGEEEEEEEEEASDSFGSEDDSNSDSDSDQSIVDLGGSMKGSALLQGGVNGPVAASRLTRTLTALNKLTKANMLSPEEAEELRKRAHGKWFKLRDHIKEKQKKDMANIMLKRKKNIFTVSNRIELLEEKSREVYASIKQLNSDVKSKVDAATFDGLRRHVYDVQVGLQLLDQRLAQGNSPAMERVKELGKVVESQRLQFLEEIARLQEQCDVP